MTTPSNDPLHGVTLQGILEALVAHYEWSGLAERIDIRCFKSDPSIKSSLTFLRKTPGPVKRSKPCTSSCSAASARSRPDFGS